MSAAEVVFNALSAYHAGGSATVSREDKIDAGRFIAGDSQIVSVIPLGGAHPQTEDSRVGFEKIRELFDISVRMSYRTGDMQTTLMALTDFVRAEIAWIIANCRREIGALDWSNWEIQFAYARSDKERSKPQPVAVIHFWAENSEIASNYAKFTQGPEISTWPPTQVRFTGDIAVGDYAPEGDEFTQTYDVPSTR